MKFGEMLPYEPRLAKKLVDPISEMIEKSVKTKCHSILFESLQLIASGLYHFEKMASLFWENANLLLEDSDWNCKNITDGSKVFRTEMYFSTFEN